ncbi:MAG: hypothetical protein CMG00_04415, partial [Candidatus Marinimicrobia bacterium]|nr:hypothetical protein [Candidatus Neomarinimicrobiota bacterium]
MCGIAGLVGSYINQDSIIIKKMINCIEHRGPDSISIKKLDQNCGYLAHARLSIIDIENGSQPMEFLSRYLITFNGEIYNYVELREELKLKGYKFITCSDTEVLLAAFHEWGSKCLNKFVGMFAFVIWDKKTQKLFAARDRFGKKPFIYTIENNIFYFASEIKSLTKTPNFAKKISRDSLIQYFIFGYVPSPNTIWENIYKLDPGCYLEW